MREQHVDPLFHSDGEQYVSLELRDTRKLDVIATRRKIWGSGFDNAAIATGIQFVVPEHRASGTPHVGL
jgi:hypothetical protein